MAHESFEDAQVADVLNRDFISIKLDREERPDVDAVYMEACQAVTGGGGWPLTVVMTPEQKPFWVGTYLSKTTRQGRMGLMELLSAIVKGWKGARERFVAAGEEITAALQQAGAAAHADPTEELPAHMADVFRQVFDPRFGGFGSAPKFPVPHNLLFLLRFSEWKKDAEARKMAEESLVHMLRGGLFDHIGGGFSRYSTDDMWLVPHFEKMLYDNALLVEAYLEAYRLTQKPLYAETVRKVLDYVLRELTDEAGGFYCGQDADSDGVEGKYYVFTPQELSDLLGEADAQIFCDWFGITDAGNFEGKSIPNLIENSQYETEPQEITKLRQKVYAYRLHRTKLHRDDKVLASWNALMISALARAGQLLSEPIYMEAAKRAQAFLAEHMTDPQGRLLLRYRMGEAGHAGQLDDYAFYALALLTLYETTFEVTYLQEAIRVSEDMLTWFWDKAEGGFFFYASDAEQLIARPKKSYDGALPSGNSVAAVVLGKLARMTGEPKWMEVSDRQLSFLPAA